ncbi:MAG: hypothetical protein ABIF85_02370 [Nanoarchaeota archaeon]|nr:hypothetical protein [Nanoarchaeota archaeon]MBU4451335.1 hypothetical protein [Nanoarchaeota archaeon]MCG2723738.1 hypothetical protein [archaeon]
MENIQIGEIRADDKYFILSFGPLKDKYVLNFCGTYYTIYDEITHFRGIEHYIGSGCGGAKKAIEIIMPKFQYETEIEFINNILSKFECETKLFVSFEE